MTAIALSEQRRDGWLTISKRRANQHKIKPGEARGAGARALTQRRQLRTLDFRLFDWRQPMWTYKRLGLFASALAGLLVATAPARAADKITIADVGAGNATNWPAYIAEANGYFRELGVEVEWVSAPSSAASTQQVAAGSANMSTGGVADPLRAIDQGAPIRILRIIIGPSPYEVFGAKDVKSLKDVAGKTVMIGGAKDITRIYFEDMAKANGLDPSKVDYVFAGSTASRFAALTSGSIAATILFPPFTFKAEGLGYTRLGASADYTKNFPFTAFSVNQAWAKANKLAIQKFLAGFARGVDWFYDKANKQAAIDIIVKVTKSDPGDSANAYDFFDKIHAWDRDGSVATSGIENFAKILKAQGEFEGSTDLTRFIDPTLIEK
jgi:NitT/TauT family transport system substrate-binding protein